MSDALPQLWAAARHVAQARVAVLAHALDDPSTARVAWEEANKLVGSLDSFGRTGGSSLARRASELLEDWPPDLQELRNVVADLRRLVDRP